VKTMAQSRSPSSSLRFSISSFSRASLTSPASLKGVLNLFRVVLNIPHGKVISWEATTTV